MWRIRQARMDAFLAHHRQQLEDKAVARGLEQGGDPLTVRECVRQGIRRASDAGLRREPEILRCLDLMRALETHPERTAWADEVLTDSDLTPALKLSLLEDGIPPGSPWMP
jgi:hypothetical protein